MSEFKYRTYATGLEITINPSDLYHERRVRKNKTEKDAKNGNARRNAERKALRAEWQNDNRSSAASFPV